MGHKDDIDALLELDGIMIEQIGGYWTKFIVSKASGITEHIPHGIRYSLTLHDNYGNRVMGFDNAHAIKDDKDHLQIEYDHHHRYIKDEGTPYKFINAYQLLKDFWSTVDKILSNIQTEEEEKCL